LNFISYCGIISLESEAQDSLILIYIRTVHRLKLKFNVKFDDKKVKSAVVREAEKAIAQKAGKQSGVPTERVEVVCINCKTKFFVPIDSGICPRCKKPLG